MATKLQEIQGNVNALRESADKANEEIVRRLTKINGNIADLWKERDILSAKISELDAGGSRAVHGLTISFENMERRMSDMERKLVEHSSACPAIAKVNQIEIAMAEQRGGSQRAHSIWEVVAIIASPIIGLIVLIMMVIVLNNAPVILPHVHP